MKFIFLLLFYTALGGYSVAASAIKKNNEPPVGYYYGKATFHSVFVNITNDTVIVDWFHIEKGPRHFFTDTLLREGIKNEWRSARVTITQSKGRVFVESQCPTDTPSKTIRIEVKINNDEYKNLESLKNASFLREEYSMFNELNKGKSKAQVSQTHAIRDSLVKKYNIAEKAGSMKHVEFLNEYQKFKKELQDELIGQ